MVHHTGSPEVGGRHSQHVAALRINILNSNSQPIQLELAVHIKKLPREGFIIIRTYHSHSNTFHHSNVWFLIGLK